MNKPTHPKEANIYNNLLYTSVVKYNNLTTPL